MNTLQIKKAMEIITKNTSVNFLGVFPSDQLPDNVSPLPSCLVYNTHPHNMPGEHWVAVFFPNDRPAEHFCSYGRKPDTVPEVHLMFERVTSTTVKWNSYRIQGYLSSACGSYAVFFLWQRTSGRTMDQVVRLLRKMGHFTSDSFVVASVNRKCRQTNEVFEDNVVVNQLCSVFLSSQIL